MSAAEASLTILCVFCNAPWTAKMRLVEAEASQGCDSCGSGGEVRATIEITCENCERVVYSKRFEEDAHV